VNGPLLGYVIGSNRSSAILDVCRFHDRLSVHLLATTFPH
jgi:hypothetical protein